MTNENSLMNTNDDGGWKSWSNFVLKTLEKLDLRLTNLEETVNEHNTSVQKSLVELQTKASISGAVVGVITSIIVSVVSGVIVYNVSKSSESKYNHPSGYTQPYYPQQPYYQGQHGQPYPGLQSSPGTQERIQPEPGTK